MSKRRVAQRGDVYWVDPNPVAGREMRNRHRLVITPEVINRPGVAMLVPIVSGGQFARSTGLTVPVTGHDTTGVVVCNQVRSFDLEARQRMKSAGYVETLDAATMGEIVDRVVSVIDPAS